MISARTRFWLRCLASLTLITLIAFKVNWAGLGSALLHINIPIAAATSALTPLLITLLAARWRIFLRQQEISLPFPKILGLTWAGQFFNSVLPGSTGGDVVKIYQICRMFPEKKAASVVAIVADRVSALLALAAFAAGGLLTGPTSQILRLGLSVNTKWLWLLAGLTALALVSLLVLWTVRHSHWGGRVRHFLSILKNSLRNWNLVGAVLVSSIIHLLNFTMFFGFARALGIDISYGQVLTMMPVIMTLLLLPLTINGLGLREVLLIFFFSYWHVSIIGSPASSALELAVSVSLLGLANELFWSLPGGVWYFLKRT